jgi:hypothetical protein
MLLRLKAGLPPNLSIVFCVERHETAHDSFIVKWTNLCLRVWAFVWHAVGNAIAAISRYDVQEDRVCIDRRQELGIFRIQASVRTCRCRKMLFGYNKLEVCLPDQVRVL